MKIKQLEFLTCGDYVLLFLSFLHVTNLIKLLHLLYKPWQ